MGLSRPLFKLKSASDTLLAWEQGVVDPSPVDLTGVPQAGKEVKVWERSR
jgi:hypothetical protein